MKHLLITAIIIALTSPIMVDEPESSKPNKELIDKKTKSWQKTKSIDDFIWIKDNVLIKGMPKEKVIEYLGEPISVDKEVNYYLYYYKKIDIKKKEFYACYLAIDYEGKLLWVGSKGAL